MVPALLTLAIFTPPLSTAFGQGALTPPGAPAPTMKTLDQIEARTPITNTSSLVTISQPGSYYLTHNLTVSSGDAIDINTNGVTLDLNGFTLTSTLNPASGNAIGLNTGVSDITILNGHVKGGVTNNAGVYRGRGFGYGIYGSSVSNVRVAGVSVSGCLYGIYLGYGNSTVVESCTVQTIASEGIIASGVSHSTATQCGYSGIFADTASDCYGSSSGNGEGVYAGASAINCYGNSTGAGTGLSAYNMQNCYGISSSGYGLSGTTAQNCYGSSNSGSAYGLYVTTAQNCYGDNGSSGGSGLFAYTAQNSYGMASGSGSGLYAYYIAIGCNGSSFSGTGLSAFIANVCHGESSSGTALSTTHNVNSF